MELYRKVRLARRDGMSRREAARQFGISRESVRKIMSFSAPPGYRRTAPIRRPKLDGFSEIIEQWLIEDVGRPRKQRRTASPGAARAGWQARRRQDGAAVPAPGPPAVPVRPEPKAGVLICAES